MNEWEPKGVSIETINSNQVLALEMKDATGKEYLDGSILRVKHHGKEILGYIRYFAGRFEIVCPFKDQRFVFGLNKDYEIIGHWLTDKILIENQEVKDYER